MDEKKFVLIFCIFSNLSQSHIKLVSNKINLSRGNLKLYATNIKAAHISSFSSTLIMTVSWASRSSKFCLTMQRRGENFHQQIQVDSRNNSHYILLFISPIPYEIVKSSKNMFWFPSFGWMYWEGVHEWVVVETFQTIWGLG